MQAVLGNDEETGKERTGAKAQKGKKMSVKIDRILYADPILPPPPKKIGDLIKTAKDNGIPDNYAAFSIYVAIVAAGNNSVNYEDILRTVKDEGENK